MTDSDRPRAVYVAWISGDRPEHFETWGELLHWIRHNGRRTLPFHVSRTLDFNQPPPLPVGTRLRRRIFR